MTSNEQLDKCLFVRPVARDQHENLRILVEQHLDNPTEDLKGVRVVRDFAFIDLNNTAATEKLYSIYKSDPTKFVLDKVAIHIDRATKSQEQLKPKSKKRKRKSAPCFQFTSSGKCEFGDECKFAHDDSNIQLDSEQVTFETPNPASVFATRSSAGQVLPARGVSKYYRKYVASLPLNDSLPTKINSTLQPPTTGKCNDKNSSNDIQTDCKSSQKLPDGETESVYAHIAPSGLCVVGIASNHPACASGVRTVTNVKFDAGKVDFTKCVIQGKKKKQSANLKAGDVLCTLNCSDGSMYTVPTPVGGRLVELGTIAQQEPSKISTDSEDSGFLAIIYPSPAELHRVQCSLVEQAD